MNVLKLAVYLLVRFYGKNHGVNQIHFFQAKCALALFLFINTLSFVGFMGYANMVPNSDNQWLKKLLAFLLLFPFYVAVSFFVKKPAVHELHRKYKSNDMKLAYSILITYAVLTVVVPGFLFVWAKS